MTGGTTMGTVMVMVMATADLSGKGRAGPAV
jgi:hypothetical protein